MPCTQSDIISVYQTQFFAKLHKQNWLHLKFLLNSNWRKEMNAMPALLKFLVLIALFLSASNANAFISPSSATGTQVRINHLIRLEKPLSKPTTDQTNDQTTINHQNELCIVTRVRMMRSWASFTIQKILNLIGHIGLVGQIRLGISFIGGFVGFAGLGLVSIAGLIGLISLGELSITSLVGSSASSVRRLIGLVGFTICSLATIAAAAILSVAVASQAAEATILTSTTKIADVAFYYFASSSLHVCLLMREKMCWWLTLARKKMWMWIPSFGDSHHGDTLQYAKQIFSARLPQMTKYCVMRECENIQSWISRSGDLVFSHHDGIYGFKFPSRFSEISCRDLTTFTSFALN